MTQIYEKTDIDGSESGQTFFCLWELTVKVVEKLIKDVLLWS